MSKKTILLLLVVITVAALLRSPLVSLGFFAFTYDQGRDLLEVQKIVAGHNLTLIGPTTGLSGIFYGPFWYYFLSPVFLIASGDPVGITLSITIVGILTVLALFFFVKSQTNSDLIAFVLGLSAAFSQIFITHSTQIWSPALVMPSMIIFIYALNSILKKSSKKSFFLLGLSSAIAFEGEVAFSVMLIASTILIFLIFSKTFFKKELIYYFFAHLLIISPRIIFEFRHDFLISRSVISWIVEPKVYQQKLTILERFANRLDLFLLNFAQTFTQSNKLIALMLLLLLILCAVKVKKELQKNSLFKTLISLTLLIYIAFSLFPDAIWDYYLVGLPPIYLAVTAIIFKYLIKTSKKLALFTCLIIILVNFNKVLLAPAAITWQGDGAIYKNQKEVIESSREKLKGDYSLYFYTPSRFDYPFEYIVNNFEKKKLIDVPKDNQKIIILIIRDDNAHTYLSSGWYGDKTHDQTQLLERRQFSGNIIFERHLVND